MQLTQENIAAGVREYPAERRGNTNQRHLRMENSMKRPRERQQQLLSLTRVAASGSGEKLDAQNRGVKLTFLDLIAVGGGLDGDSVRSGRD